MCMRSLFPSKSHAHNPTSTWKQWTIERSSAMARTGLDCVQRKHTRWVTVYLRTFVCTKNTHFHFQLAARSQNKDCNRLLPRFLCERVSPCLFVVLVECCRRYFFSVPFLDVYALHCTCSLFFIMFVRVCMCVYFRVCMCLEEVCTINKKTTQPHVQSTDETEKCARFRKIFSEMQCETTQKNTHNLDYIRVFHPKKKNDNWFLESHHHTKFSLCVRDVRWH